MNRRIMEHVEGVVVIAVGYLMVTDLVVAVVLRVLGVGGFAIALTIILLPVALCIALLVIFSIEQHRE